MNHSKIAAGAVVSALGIWLVACGDGSSNSSAPPEKTPAEKISSMRPPEQEALLYAYGSHDAAIESAPNRVARDEARQAEDPKLCKAIDDFKQFRNWTGKVRSIRPSDDKPGAIDIAIYLDDAKNYSAFATVEAASPLYPKIKTMSDGDNASPVVISGAVLKAEVGFRAVTDVLGSGGTALECAGRTGFIVNLSAIDLL